MAKALQIARNTRALIQEMIKNMDLKYKIIAGLLAAGVGGFTIVELLGRNVDPYADPRDQYMVRRIVNKWWVPMIDTQLESWFGSMKTNIEMEIERAKTEMAENRWLYPDNNILADVDMESYETAEEARMEEFDAMDLLHLHRATKVLGEIDKEHVLRLWKEVELLEIQQDEYLFKIGDSDDHIYIMLEGQVEVYCVDHNLDLSPLHIETKSNRMILTHVYPGQTIYSILSFLDVLTGHDEPVKTIEAVAKVRTVVFRLTMLTYKKYWYEHPTLLTRAVRRLLRRIYQVVFVALHKVLGLSTELIKDNRHPVVNADFLADTEIDVPNNVKRRAIAETMNYLGLEGDENAELMSFATVLILGQNVVAVKAGDRTSKFAYVYKGELEVSQRVSYDDSRIRTETDEILFYVSEGQAIGGLSYLTDDVNVFNVKVPQKALVVVIEEALLTKLVDRNPFMIRVLAHSVVGRLSPFAREMDFGLEWTKIESGNMVYRAGDPPIYTYLVLSGRLRSILSDTKGRNTMKGEYGRNDWIGLVETLTKRQRSKSVVASRDTELAKIPDGLLTLIKLKFPVVAMRLLDFLGQRVAKNYRNSYMTQKVPRGSSTLALIPLRDSVPTRVFAHSLKKNYNEFGNVTEKLIKVMTVEFIVDLLGEDCLLEENDNHLNAYLASQEDRYGLIIFVAEPEPDPKKQRPSNEESNRSWTKKCIKQADKILILADGAEKRDSNVTPIEELVNFLAPRANKELILVHSCKEDGDTRVYPVLTRMWLNKRDWLTFHHHIGLPPAAYDHLKDTYDHIAGPLEKGGFAVEIDKHSDFARLTRWLCKSSIGIVLGGGGAKGAAHIGVIKVLRKELDIPIDYIAGVSIGSFVGGLYAMSQDVDFVEETARNWFDKISKSYQYIFDITIPHLSLFRGEAFNNSIRACFGDTQIEDLRIPYFTVSTDMTANRSRVHKSGPLWRYARASMTLSGYFPPICDLDGHFLMDGGYTNLVPANLMRSFGVGWIIGVDVSAMDPVETTNYGDQLSGLRAVLPHIIPYVRPHKIPTYFALQQQLSFVQSALFMGVIKEMDRSSIYLRPPLDFYATSDFPCFEHIKDVGYVYTQQLCRHCDKEDKIEILWNRIAQDLASLSEDIKNSKLRQRGDDEDVD